MTRRPEHQLQAAALEHDNTAALGDCFFCRQFRIGDVFLVRHPATHDDQGWSIGIVNADRLARRIEAGQQIGGGVVRIVAGIVRARFQVVAQCGPIVEVFICKSLSYIKYTTIGARWSVSSRSVRAHHGGRSG